MDNDGFITATSRRRQKPQRAAGVMRGADAEALEERLNIYGLAGTIMSREGRALQERGYRFDRVICGNAAAPQGEEDAAVHELLDIDNVYGDVAVFVRRAPAQ